MGTLKEGSLLWQPDKAKIKNSNLNHFMNWLQQNKGLDFKDYSSMWNWSIEQTENFWVSIWEYFQIKAKEPYKTILSSNTMPGAKWFQEASINYVEHVFRNRKDNDIAIIHTSETRKNTEVTWKKLYQDTIKVQQKLIQLSVKKGDRIVAYLPNIYETVVCFLATASLGAIWSSASPDFGTQSVIDRFKQIEPKLMFTIDGYSYGGKTFNRIQTVQEIQTQLPTLEATITIAYMDKGSDFSTLKSPIALEQVISANIRNEKLYYEYVPFNDPLWILFSSGTTGKPKPIVHSQGGILIEHLKTLSLHVDLNEKSRFFWFTTTGWMMWNFLIGGLLTGSTIILYDGNPTYPNQNRLFRLAEETKMTVFGTSASYITSCMKTEMNPRKEFDLSHLQCISSTGSPLPPEGFKWCYDYVKKDLWIASVSGGTDVCSAFVLGSPTLPVHAGELQCIALGAKVESFDEKGNPIIDRVGELVITKPYPSMPIFFWNDPDGKRLYDSYFDYYPGIWRHGDYIKITNRGSCVIYGRSDATINRGGIRIGTSEIYRAVDQVKEIQDSLIVDVPTDRSESATPLFVIMKDGYPLTEEVKQKINKQIRTQCSPRHVPTGIFEVKDIPRTLNGKKLEVPIKKILMGKSVDEVVNKGSLANVNSLDYFVEFAKKEFIKGEH